MSIRFRYHLALAALTLTLADTAAAQSDGSSTWRVNRHGVLTVDGERFFPIGLTMPPPLGSSTPWGRDAVAELAGAGVNLFRTGPIADGWTTEYLNQAIAWNAAAARHDVYTWLQLRGLALLRNGNPRMHFLRRVVDSLKNSPGMGLWKGWDEPWPRHRPRGLRDAYDLITNRDRNHLFTTVFAPRSRDRTLLRHGPQPPNLRPYRRVMDVTGVNVYPIYHRHPGGKPDPLHFVGDWTRAIRRATGMKAVTTTIQICFAGSDDRGGSGEFVLPTRRQERFMIYDAIVNGARGLVFYGGQNRICHTPDDRARGWNWTYWRSTLRELVQELREGSRLHPALLRPETTRRLTTGDAGAQAISRTVGRAVWVFVTNRRLTGATVSVRGLPPWAQRGRTYPEGRVVRVVNGRLRLGLDAWGVRVVRFFRPR